MTHKTANSPLDVAGDTMAPIEERYLVLKRKHMDEATFLRLKGQFAHAAAEGVTFESHWGCYDSAKQMLGDYLKGDVALMDYTGWLLYHYEKERLAASAAKDAYKSLSKSHNWIRWAALIGWSAIVIMAALGMITV